MERLQAFKFELMPIGKQETTERFRRRGDAMSRLDDVKNPPPEGGGRISTLQLLRAKSVYVHEHWSSNCVAVIVRGNRYEPTIRIKRLGLLNRLGTYADFESAKQAALEWLMRSEERIGSRNQAPTPVRCSKRGILAGWSR